MESCITFKNLSIGYRPKHQLRVIASAVSASLHPGELTCLIGANGVGKSTLLRTLCGFQPALDGEILLQNQPLSAYPAQQLARQIGVVLTSRIDVPQLSVKEIVGIGRSPYTNFWGTLTPADQQIVDEAIQQVGIPHLAQRNISELSDGERQKTMIAKALAQQTRIIILDEPTAFLDSPCHMLQKLARLCHFPFQQFIYLGIIDGAAEFIGLHGTGEIVFQRQIDEIIIAHRILLLQHSMIGMEANIPEINLTALHHRSQIQKGSFPQDYTYLPDCTCLPGYHR